MTAFSPVSAALEGFRVMRREPKAVLYWIAVWALALAAIATIKALGGPIVKAPNRDSVGIIRSYGRFATILAPAVLALWVMNTATVYRAVLRPGEHGWHLFKLGSDEARIAVISAIGTVLIVAFGGVPAYLLFVLFSPIFAAAPSQNWMIAVAGAITTVVLEIWIGVRFSLAPVQTFAERRFPLSSFWAFTRGSAWRLLGAYLLVVLEIAVFFVAFAGIGLLLEPAFAAVLRWHGPRLAQQLLILGVLVPVAALSSAVAFVIPSTLICGAQAFAYRAILGAQPAPTAPAAA